MIALLATHVIFVQFAGAMLQPAATDDARQDRSALGMAAVPAFDPDATARAVVLGRMRTLFATYDVAVTDARPASGDYSMVVVGGTHDVVNAPLGAAGLSAGVDCNDTNPANVSFVFSDEIQALGGGLVAVAATAAHEAGHTFGLEHTDDPLDLMYSVAQPMLSVPIAFQQSFRQTGSYSPFQITGNAPASCLRADPINAGVLATNLGLRTGGDQTAPTLNVSFTRPALQVAASDDAALERIEVYKDLALLASSPTSPLTTTVDGAPGDHFQLTVEAVDATGNRTTHTEAVDIPLPPDAGPDPLDPVDMSTATAPPPPSGCDYVPTPAPLPLALALAFPLALLRNRRR